MVTKNGLYPAEKYVDEYEKEESEECRKCKGGCGYIPMSGEYACKGFRPMTNAEYIRSKNDQELAEWIYSLIIDRYIGVPVKEWLNWLKQEVDYDKSGQDQRDDG